MSREAMKLALEALELNNDEWKSLADSGDSGYWKAEDQDHYQQTNKAITALREALAEQPAQQEPEWYHFVKYGEDCFVPYSGQAPEKATPLYTSPPAQRTWVGLTDEDIDRVTDAQWAKGANKPIYAAHRAYARSIEAKLKEKNT